MADGVALICSISEARTRAMRGAPGRSSGTVIAARFQVMVRPGCGDRLAGDVAVSSSSRR